MQYYILFSPNRQPLLTIFPTLEDPSLIEEKPAERGLITTEAEKIELNFDLPKVFGDSQVQPLTPENAMTFTTGELSINPHAADPAKIIKNHNWSQNARKVFAPTPQDKSEKSEDPTSQPPEAEDTVSRPGVQSGTVLIPAEFQPHVRPSEDEIEAAMMVMNRLQAAEDAEAEREREELAQVAAAEQQLALEAEAEAKKEEERKREEEGKSDKPKTAIIEVASYETAEKDLEEFKKEKQKAKKVAEEGEEDIRTQIENCFAELNSKNSFFANPPINKISKKSISPQVCFFCRNNFKSAFVFLVKISLFYFAAPHCLANQPAKEHSS